MRFPPPHLVSSDGILDDQRKTWIQADKWWLVVLYGHSGTALINAVSHQFQPGTLLLFPPGSRGTHLSVGPNTEFAQFQFMLQEDDRDVVSLPVHAQIDEANAKEFRSRVAMINVSFAPVQAFLWNFLWTISQHPRLVETDNKLLDAEEFMAKHMSHPLTVDSVCRAVEVPYRTLARLFEVEHGMGIHRYLVHLRGREAVRLLTETTLPAKQIAARIGVPDLHQFNKLIRRTVGLSPRKVRAQLTSP